MRTKNYTLLMILAAAIPGALPAAAHQAPIPAPRKMLQVQIQTFPQGAFDGPDDGGIVVEDDGGEMRTPIAPRVNQILINIDGSVTGAKTRAEAEEKLVALGADALPTIKSLIPSHKGRARDLLTVAAFRLENAPLAPRESIAAWVAKKAQADPSSVALQRLSADDLRKVFPNHLFYTAEIKSSPAAKATYPKTLLAIAADGKVQEIGNDQTLAVFLKHELQDGTAKTERRRNAAAAAVLALGRDTPDGADITSDGVSSDTAATGTAFITGNPTRKTTITLTFDLSGRVSAIVTKFPDPAQVEEQPKPAADIDAPKTPAATNPATTAPTLAPEQASPNADQQMKLQALDEMARKLAR